MKTILASSGFVRAVRMQRFLTFVVEGALTGTGQAEDLKESVVGIAVFDRAPDYDLKTDPVVRVEARRLRDKLDEYYDGPGKEDKIRIKLPKGSYAPFWTWQGEPVLAAPVFVVEEPVPRPARGRLIPYMAASSATFALLLILFAYSDWGERFGWRRHDAGAIAGIRSLAVLPFRNLSADPKQDYLISGLTDEIITELAKSKTLTVISRTSTDCYRGSTKHLPEIARELHVDAVVEGTVESSGARVRVTAKLIRASTDSHLWAETYERDTDDLFALQSEIAEDIARKIGLTVTPTGSAAALDHPVQRDAYEAYLRGRYFWNRRTLDGLRKSISYYGYAIQADPSYAKAYAGLANSYIILSSYGGPSPADSLVRAQEAARHALRLDNALAEPYVSLAEVKIDLDWDWQGATRDFERALQVSPGDPTAHHWYALHLSRMQQHRKAREQIGRALALDPLSLIINTDAAEVFYCARDNEGALAHVQRALELDNNFAEAHLVLGKIYEQKKDFARAGKEYDLANTLFGDMPNVWALQGHALALAGNKREALSIAAKLEAASTQRYVSGADIAIVYCGLGDHVNAMKWLDKAYESHGKGLNIIGADPLFDNCRTDPKFQALLQRLRLTP